MNIASDAQKHQHVLTVEEAGRMLRLSRSSMYSAIARNEIPAIRLGRRLLIPRAALYRMLSEARIGEDQINGNE
jgi:excisionase family DNA binding protein